MFVFLVPVLTASQEKPSGQHDDLRNALTFYASFDGTTDADFAKGDNQIHTATSYDKLEEATPAFTHLDISILPGKGRFGDALEFSKKSKQIVFYPAEGNVAYDPENWNGTVSFWLQLDPAEDLEPGYCDPIQITDAAYNDAALWVDFSDKNPRKFRLGVIGDLNHWNPKNEDNEAAFLEQLVAAPRLPFSRETWTHVLFTFSNLNGKKSEAKFYLDGKLQAPPRAINDPFTWDIEKAKIILGLNYIGLFDELLLFNKALSDEEVMELYQLEEGGKSLIQN